MNNLFKNIAIFSLIGILMCSPMLLSFQAAAASLNANVAMYDVNGDEVVDIRDLVCAKKLSVNGNSFYDSVFLTSLRRFLLGVGDSSETNTGGHINENGEIVMPIAP